MKLGEEITQSTIEVIAAAGELRIGVVQFRHPRCGRVTIRRQKSGMWVVEKCERPDP